MYWLPVNLCHFYLYNYPWKQDVLILGVPPTYRWHYETLHIYYTTKCRYHTRHLDFPPIVTSGSQTNGSHVHVYIVLIYVLILWHWILILLCGLYNNLFRNGSYFYYTADLWITNYPHLFFYRCKLFEYFLLLFILLQVSCFLGVRLFCQIINFLLQIILIITYSTRQSIQFEISIDNKPK